MHEAGGTPFDHFLQLIAFVLQRQAVNFAPFDITENGSTHIVQCMRHGVDFIETRRATLVQAQRFLPVAGPHAPGKLGHDLQMTGYQTIEQPRQGHRQAAQKHTHP
ncbi:hypothetical protein D3C77_639610 [compost metagenome]